MTDVLDLLELPHAAVAPGALVVDAARVLYDVDVGAIAVVEGKRVRGMVTEDDVMSALFPAYLRELTHTAFVDSDALVRADAEAAAATTAAEIMRRAELVELPASALDVAQRFLHSDSSALVAVRDGAFAGVIDQRRFTQAILTRRYGWQL